MENKCSKCKVDKNINGFVKNKSYCRICARLMCKVYKEKNKEKISQYNKKYKLENKEKISEYNKQYNIDNRKEIQKRHTEYLKNKRKTDIHYKISVVLRNRIKSLLKGEKRKKTIELLGCDLNFFQNWLKYQLVDTMTLENHGKIWHIDHVIPCAKFDLKNIEEQKKCFNWTNLQPMFSSENMSKKDNIILKDIFAHEIKLYSFIIKNKINTKKIIKFDKTKYLNKVNKLK